MKRTILVTGGTGQVGIELRRLDWPDDVRLCAPSRNELDITDRASVSAYFRQLQPQCVINLAAYTAVDQAETDLSAAFLLNSQAAAHLAEDAEALGAPIIQVSTDYVFDGSADRPYVENDAKRPINVYGASKLAGELAVVAGNSRAIVLRTAWVLSAHRKNFIKTILRLAATDTSLRVIADQHGCPTSARDIAGALRLLALRAIEDPNTPWGTYHFVNAGEASWHGLASYVLEHRACGGAAQIEAISSSDYISAARRPANSRLNATLIEKNFGITPRPWQEAVDEILSQLANATEEELLKQ